MSPRSGGGAGAGRTATVLAPAPFSRGIGSRAEHAYEAIKQRIFDFDLMPGDRLSESELAAQLDVSRTPLRQALQRLQHEGLVAAVPKVGWTIPALDFDRFDELYDFRTLIECYAVRALCDEVDERPVLRDLADLWQAPAPERPGDPMTVGPLDEAFHAALVESTGNREMARTYREITERMRIIRRLDFFKPDRVAATYDEHAAILLALERRRAEEAQRLLRAHIEQSKIEVRKITLDMLFQARTRARSAP